MSIIYSECKKNGLIQSSPVSDWSTIQSPLGSLKFLNGGPVNWTAALIDTGKPASQITLKSLSSDEVNAIVSKLDMMFRGPEHEDVAIMVAEEMLNILATVQAVGYQTQSSFGGILATGTQLDIWPLRPKDVGGSLLNPAATATKGLYGGTSAMVYDWLTAAALTGGTIAHIIPSQIMWQYAGMLYLGGIEKVAVPKIEGIQFTLAGSAAVPQPVVRNIKKLFGVPGGMVSFTRLEKPVIIPPLKTQAVDVMPGTSGDSDFEIIALVVGQAQDKAL